MTLQLNFIDADQFVICQNCNMGFDYDDAGIIGACPEKCFCPNCETEIDSTTGEIALLCGKCSWCQEFMIEGTFDEAQKKRMELRNEPRA